MNKKCICTNQKNEPCSWSSLQNKLFCKKHMIYDGIYNENELKSIKKCSTCRMYMLPNDTKQNFKICSKCRDISKSNREKNKIKLKCKGICNNGSICYNKPLENNEYS